MLGLSIVTFPTGSLFVNLPVGSACTNLPSGFLTSLFPFASVAVCGGFTAPGVAAALAAASAALAAAVGGTIGFLNAEKEAATAAKAPAKSTGIARRGAKISGEPSAKTNPATTSLLCQRTPTKVFLLRFPSASLPLINSPISFKKFKTAPAISLTKGARNL